MIVFTAESLVASDVDGLFVSTALSRLRCFDVDVVLISSHVSFSNDCYLHVKILKLIRYWRLWIISKVIVFTAESL